MQGKITVSFLTNNVHKFIEAKEALALFPGIELRQIKEDKIEYKDDSLEDPIKEIAKKAAKEGAEKYRLPLAAEDTGLFLKAYPGFPGLNTKWVMKKIGYDGFLRLLDGKDRSAWFQAVVAYCEPRGEPLLFEGRIEGTITKEVIGMDIDCMDFDRIFIPEGFDKPFSLMMEEKKRISHRKIAFRKLGEYLQGI